MSKTKGHSIKVVYPAIDNPVKTGRGNRYFLDGVEFDLVTNFKMELSPNGFNNVTLSFLVSDITFEEDDSNQQS